MKSISIKFPDEELAELDRKVLKVNMSRSDYIRHHVMSGEAIQIADKSKEFYQSLNQIYKAICKFEASHPKVECGAIRGEVCFPKRIFIGWKSKMSCQGFIW